MSYVFYDPTYQLWPSGEGYMGFFDAILANGAYSVNMFSDITNLTAGPTITEYGEFGVLESLMQTFSPVSAAPYKYQGVAYWQES
jgi:hypothetical protein